MLMLRGGQVLSVDGERFERVDVAVHGERIRAVGPLLAGHADDIVVDVTGQWLIPGLIDCHVHLTNPTDTADPWSVASRTDAEVTIHAIKAAERTLQAGITTVRDVGGWNYVEIAVRNAINAGLLSGPRIFAAGKLLSISTDTIDYYPGMYEIADGADAVRRAARVQLANGADLIKVMATGAMLSSETEDSRSIQFTLEELKAAVEIAHDNHKHVAAHAHALRGIENCVAAGVDSIEHCTFADEAALRSIAAAGTFVVPTICAFELLVRDPGVMAGMPEHQRARMLDSNDIHHAAIRRANELGVRIAMGTDAGTPGNHHGMNAHELVYLVQDTGLSPSQSIRAATANAATLLRRQDDLGTIEVGKIADIVAMPTNPFDDIAAVTDIRLVMKAGAVVRDEATTQTS